MYSTLPGGVRFYTRAILPQPIPIHMYIIIIAEYKE